MSNPKDAVGRKKDPISLVPPAAIRATSHAMRYGAYEAKRADGQMGYGPYNWRSTKIYLTVYIDALLRHALEVANGNDIDKDSGQSHWNHILANAAIVVDAQEHGCLIDDRKTTKQSAVKEHTFPESWACKNEKCKGCREKEKSTKENNS